MTTFQAIVYGLVHALTLWLPVSDQAHLWWVGKLLDWPAPSGLFLGAFFLGTALAAVVFYIHDWLSMASSTLRMLVMWRKPNSIDERMPFFILLTTLPWLIVRATGHDALELWNSGNSEIFSSWATVVGMIIFAGFWAFAFQWNRQNKTHLSWNWLDSLSAGFAQLLHLVPGAGRQLGVIALANIRGYQRDAIWKYAILSFTPMLAIRAAELFHESGWVATESPDFNWLSWGVALAMSFFVSMLVFNAVTQSATRPQDKGVTRYRVVVGLMMGGYVLLRL